MLEYMLQCRHCIIHVQPDCDLLIYLLRPLHLPAHYVAKSINNYKTYRGNRYVISNKAINLVTYLHYCRQSNGTVHYIDVSKNKVDI